MAAAKVDAFKAEMAPKSNLEMIADGIIKQVNSTYHLKSKQMACIDNIVKGKDTLAANCLWKKHDLPNVARNLQIPSNWTK